jgi:hypothetical protein
MTRIEWTRSTISDVMVSAEFGGVMKKSKLETAKSLANAHFQVEPNLKRIYLIQPINDQDPNDPIKLLEVVEGTIERGIEPVSFPADPARGMEYPLMIIEISPTEYKSIRTAGKVRLRNHDWTIGEELLAR